MELDPALVRRVLEDDLEATEPRLRAALEVIRAVTETSQEVKPAIRAALEARVSRQALDDVIHICCTFNVITRIADTFDFEVPHEPELSRHARFVYKRGYGR